MAGFVYGDGAFFFGGGYFVAFFEPADYAVDSGVEVILVDMLFCCVWRLSGAASLHTLAISAPKNRSLACQKIDIESGAVFTLRRCTFEDFHAVGAGRSRSTYICRSETSGAHESLVEDVGAVGGGENNHTAVAAESVHFGKELVQGVLALVVCSHSAFLPRARPTASISSMKTMQGAFSFAWRKRSRTRDAPTPTNISTKSEPLMEKKGTSASPPPLLPAGSYRSRRAYKQCTFGNFSTEVGVAFWVLEKLYYFFNLGLCFGVSATSRKVTRSELFLSNSMALDFPTLKIPPPPPAAPPPPHRTCAA